MEIENDEERVKTETSEGEELANAPRLSLTLDISVKTFCISALQSGIRYLITLL